LTGLLSILAKPAEGFGAKLIQAMTHRIERLFVAALWAALLCGCGKNSPKAVVDSKAFGTAAPGK
jgi:hypothetical protein